LVEQKRAMRSVAWMKHIGYTREKTVKPEPLGTAEADAATLQEKILALLDGGVIPAAARLREKFPPGLLQITRLPGLGPKRVRGHAISPGLAEEYYS